MDWSKVLGLAAIVLFLFGVYQSYRFIKEFQKLNSEERMPEQFLGKWDKRLTFILVLCILGLVFGIVASLFH